MEDLYRNITWGTTENYWSGFLLFQCWSCCPSVLLLWFILIVIIVCFLFDFLFALFRIAWWSSVGKELISWLSASAVLYLMPSLMSMFLSCLVSWAGCSILGRMQYLGQDIVSWTGCSILDRMQYLGQDAEFDCAGSWSLPFHLVCMGQSPEK